MVLTNPQAFEIPAEVVGCRLYLQIVDKHAQTSPYCLLDSKDQSFLPGGSFIASLGERSGAKSSHSRLFLVQNGELF